MLRNLKMRWLGISIAMDLGLTILALVLARYIREYIPAGIYFDTTETFGFVKLDEPLYFNYVVLIPLILVIWISVFSHQRIYGSDISINKLGEMQPVFMAVTGATLILAGCAYFFFRDLSRFLFVYFYVLDLFFLIIWRKVILWMLQKNRLSTWRPKRKVLVVGTGTLADNIVRLIESFAWSGLELTDVVGDQWRTDDYVKKIPQLVIDLEIDEVIFALPAEHQGILKELVWQLQPLSVNIWLVPDVTDMVFVRASIEDLGGVLLIGLREPALSVFDRWLKRLFDVVVASLLLILSAPLFLLIILLLKIESCKGCPVFYAQQRVGEGGKLFRMYKFRTMVHDADKQEIAMLKSNSNRLGVNKTPNDPRITRFGRFLRRTSLDELPQLINVIKGDMSLVGPRPELPWMVQDYDLWQYQRFTVPQGMTGWWQIKNRDKQIEYDIRVDDDLYYIHNYAFILDLRILLTTIWTIIRGNGAY